MKSNEGKRIWINVSIVKGAGQLGGHLPDEIIRVNVRRQILLKAIRPG